MNKYQWKIFLVNLDPVTGSQQGRTRPVLIISDDNINSIMPIVNIVPITSRKNQRTVYPNEVLLEKGVGNLKNDSIILSHQIRTIDKKRLIKELGELNDEKLKEEIYQSILFQIGYYNI